MNRNVRQLHRPEVRRESRRRGGERREDGRHSKLSESLQLSDSRINERKGPRF